MGRHRTEPGRCDRRRPRCPRRHAHSHGATASQHVAPRPYSGTGQGTHAHRPCAHNILRPGHTAALVTVPAFAAPGAHNTLRPCHTAAQVDVLTLAAPSLTACCVHAILHAQVKALTPAAPAPTACCAQAMQRARCYVLMPAAPCAGFVQRLIPIGAGLPQRIPVLKGPLHRMGLPTICAATGRKRADATSGARAAPGRMRTGAAPLCAWGTRKCHAAIPALSASITSMRASNTPGQDRTGDLQRVRLTS